MMEALEIFKQYHNNKEYPNSQYFRKNSEKIIDGEAYGIPLYFVNYNPKKPFLKNRNIKHEGIYLCKLDEAILRYNFHEWLWQFHKQQTIFMYYDGKTDLNNRTRIKPCIYLQVDKDNRGRLHIIDYEILP